MQPKLRFKGFNDDWEQRKLGEVGEITAGGDKDPKKLKKEGKYPVIANNLENDGIIGYYKNNYKIDAPAITITARGNIGSATARVVNFTPVVRLLVLKTNLDTKFMEQSINNIKFFIESTGVPQLTVPQFSNYSIFIPKKTEQYKIGLIFNLIDTLITLYEQKINLLLQIKKYFLQKLFANEKQKQPEIRFKGFNNKWNQIRLSNIIVSEFKGTHKFNDLQKDINGCEYLDTERLNGNVPILVNAQKDVDYNDVLILWDGSKAGSIYHGFGGVLGSTLKCLKMDNKENSTFIYYILKNNQKLIMKKYRTPNIPHVIKNFTKLFKIKITIKEEQNKIAKLLSKVDHLINLYEQKEAKLKAIKKYLLQNMFC